MDAHPDAHVRTRLDSAGVEDILRFWPTDSTGAELPRCAVFVLAELTLDQFPACCYYPGRHLRGAEWDAPQTDGYYSRLEAEIAAHRSDPLVATRAIDGSVHMIDGSHRLSIARHLGMESIGVYLHDEQPA